MSTDREYLTRLRAVEGRTTSAPLVDGPPVVWDRATGSRVLGVDGREYLDLTAGAGVASVGHSHPHVTAAIADQAARLTHTGWQFASTPRVALLERVADLLPPPLDSLLIAVTGTEAVEAALKLATSATGRRSVLGFQGGYHGKSSGALRVTARPAFRRGVLDRTAETLRLPYPGGAYCWLGHPGDRCTSACLDAIERLLDHPDTDWDDVAAIVVEPVLGAGGMVVPPAEFLARLRRLCTDRGALLIVDEIYTGFGRTGRMFGFEHSDVVPDVVVLGKSLGAGLPVSLVAAPRALTETMPDLLQTSTFSGSPLACAAGLAVLDVLAKEELVGRAAERGRQLLAGLTGPSLAGLHDRLHVRGLGLMVGVELEPANPDRGRAACAAVVRAAAERGVLVFGGGVRGNVLKLTPPLVITEAECDRAVTVLAESIREVL